MEAAVTVGEFEMEDPEISGFIKVFWGNDYMVKLPEAFDTFTATLLPGNKLQLEATTGEEINEGIYIEIVVATDDGSDEYVYGYTILHVETEGNEIVFDILGEYYNTFNVKGASENLNW